MRISFWREWNCEGRRVPPATAADCLMCAALRFIRLTEYWTDRDMNGEVVFAIRSNNEVHDFGQVPGFSYQR